MNKTRTNRDIIIVGKRITKKSSLPRRYKSELKFYNYLENVLNDFGILLS